MIAHASLLIVALVITETFARLTFRPKVNAASLPTTWDWRTRSQELGTAFTSVLDQGECGGCWAFSTVDAAGAWMQMATNGTSEAVKAPMSPQYQLDCDKRNISYYGMDVTQAGCDGGITLTSYRELAWEIGTLENQCQPFTGDQRSKCTNKCETTTANSKNYKKWENETNYFRPINFWVYDYDAEVDYRSVGKANKARNSNADSDWPWVTPHHLADVLKEIIYNCGPSSVGFTSCDSFSEYTSGSGNNINIYKEDIDEMLDQDYYGCGGHAVTVYGWGIKNGVEYWIIKNSWGPGFGDGGYFYIRAGLMDYDIEEEITSFCPKDVFSGTGSGKGDFDFGFYDWTLRNGTHIDFIRDESGKPAWVVDGKSVLEDPSEDGCMFSWTALNMGLSSGAKIGIFGTLLITSLLTQLL